MKRSAVTSTRRARHFGVVLVVTGMLALAAPAVVGTAGATSVVADPATDTVSTPVPDSTIIPAPDPTAAPVADPATDPATDPASDPATGPVTDPASDPATAPGTDPASTPTPTTAPVPAAVAPTAAPTNGAVAAEEPVPNPPEGVTITVNGLPMTGGEGGKISSCTISIGVSGLPENPDPATAIGVTIKAVPPMTPEGSPVELVNQSFTTSAADWSQDFPMDALVAPFTPHSNGYHLRVNVTINGTLAGSSVYWLGCGQPQTGNPTRILFAVEWHANDGTVSTTAPLALLPADWQPAFLLDGASKKGTAECTYAALSGVLDCTYDNPGHGDQPGLVVPGNPEATYTVSVAGVPATWSADPASLGTFVGRDTCPRGHEDDGDGDEGEVGVTAGDGDGDEGPWVCTHTVVLVQAPAPPSPPTVEATAVTASPQALAMTGGPSALLTSIAVLLLLSGSLLLGWSALLRRRAAQLEIAAVVSTNRPRHRA